MAATSPLVIFDLDGTLVDSYAGIVECALDTLRYHGYDTPRSIVESMVGSPLNDIFLACGAAAQDIQVLIDDYRSRYTVEGLTKSMIFAGVPEMLTTLNADGMYLAVATTKLEAIAIAMLDHHGLRDEFATVVGATHDGSRDHKKELITEVLARLPRDTANVVMVGDRGSDIYGAQQCGVASIGVTWGYSNENELVDAAPNNVAESPSALPAIVTEVLNTSPLS